MLYLLLKLWYLLTGRDIRRGKVFVCAGCPDEIEIKTGFMPTSISLTFCNFAQPPVCVGDVDCFDVKAVKNGFVIIARINGQAREIKWTAVGRW